ncbi:hypothetical protein Scep_001851 [Stephania cephalantha]|uniref:Pentatricopeptide repeat-containing protein n=1 Tax=Stephania cephalantha TaxID=152367 RepID=A0AAP0Q451_9MAGN
MVASSVMLLPSSLHVLQFQPTCFLPIQPSQSSSLKLRSSHIVSNASFKSHSASTQFQNSFKCQSIAQIPDTHILDFLFGDYPLIDPVILASSLQNCLSVREIRRVHSLAVKCYGNSVKFVNNNLISVYVRMGKLFDARKVFDEMPERNIVSWTAILNGYLKLGGDDEVLELFNELIEVGVQPNSKTFVCVLNLCARRVDFALGRQIHACVVKGNWSNLIVDCAVLYFYAQCDDLAGAFQVFNRMPMRDVVSWTTMVTACSQHGDADSALSMFLRMRLEDFSPNEFTVCAALKACGKKRDVKFGKQLHSAIVKRVFKDDVFVGTSTLGMYMKCKDTTSARKVFDRMKKRNTVTWTSLIAGYAQNGLGEEAISLFRVMKARNIFANNLTILSVLRACGLLRLSLLGREVHAQILRNSIQTNIYIGSTLVWFYCRCEDHVSAAKVLQEMPHRDVISWTAIISGYAHLGQDSHALQFLSKMLLEGVEPNPFTYSSALKACASLEAILHGKLIHSSVNKTYALSNVFVGSALINMYAKCGHVTEAARVFDSMPEHNLVSLKSMIIAYAKSGYCQEALKLMYRLQAGGVHVDDYLRTTVLSACGDVEWDTESLPECSFQPM